MTGLFGGAVKLGSAFDRNETALRRDFELRRSKWDRGAKYVYRGAGDFLLQHGKCYPGRACPDQYRHLMGEEGECFNNAIAACLAAPELQYCEGFYTTGHSYPCAHAWCIAPDGGVVELTLPSDPDTVKIMVHADTGMPYMEVKCWAYWGAIFTVDFARAHMDSIGQPMFDRGAGEVTRYHGGMDLTEPHDFPVLQMPYDPNRTDMP